MVVGLDINGSMNIRLNLDIHLYYCDGCSVMSRHDQYRFFLYEITFDCKGMRKMLHGDGNFDC